MGRRRLLFEECKLADYTAQHTQEAMPAGWQRTSRGRGEPQGGQYWYWPPSLDVGSRCSNLTQAWTASGQRRPATVDQRGVVLVSNGLFSKRYQDEKGNKYPNRAACERALEAEAACDGCAGPQPAAEASTSSVAAASAAAQPNAAPERGFVFVCAACGAQLLLILPADHVGPTAIADCAGCEQTLDIDVS
mmetsp:Transcript_51114/g.161642  ORF Transcript_51114/g.161642 Transcript_51114/m.161642 type:complete len:191 (+) Transcript_51114:39-611(+)